MHIDGRLLWIGGANSKQQRHVGDRLTRDGVKLVVVGAIVADGFQHVAVELDEPTIFQAKVRQTSKRRETAANDVTIPAVRVPRAMLEALQAIADQRREPLSQVIRQALQASTG